jgi:hypothetical protein
MKDYVNDVENNKKNLEVEHEKISNGYGEMQLQVSNYQEQA